jgi:hypothetical protein
LLGCFQTKENVMSRSDTRYSVYPAPKAVEIVGNTAPALNQAIECWAALLARATADNSRMFHQTDTKNASLTGEYWGMDEWSLLTEVVKGMRFDPEFANPGQLLATAVEDAHRLEYIGAKNLDWGGCDSSVITEKHIDAEVATAVEKLRNLDYAHAWAVIVTIQWFWEHHSEGIDIKNDPWWTLAFRRQWKAKRAGGQDASRAEERRRKTATLKRKPPTAAGPNKSSRKQSEIHRE